MNDLLTTEDTLVLDEMLSHEAKCTVPHEETVCSVIVTHHTTSKCGGDYMACTNSALRTMRIIESKSLRCHVCKRMVEDDWTVTPA